jgi:carbonic anhydrase
MHRIKPLPAYLVQRYRGWKATAYDENKGWYRRLADEGQRPRVMVIACSDSRVHIASIFAADTGEIFTHRNVANLVPPYEPDGDHHGTSAAVEYAVVSLKVAHLIVLGHSNCGGVAGCAKMCAGHAPELERTESFVGRWLDILRPGYEKVAGIEDPKARATALEKEAVMVSMQNLLTFPFVTQAMEAEDLKLHGLWHDIGDGRLDQYLEEAGGFVPV